VALLRWDALTSQYVNLRTGAHIDPGPSPVAGWPDETNTGFLGDPATLTPIAGYTVTTPGAVIENMLISDALRIEAANVTVRNCRINAGYYGVLSETSATGLRIEDVTVVGGDVGLSIQGAGSIIRRCNVSDGEDGMKIGGNNSLIEDNYIHDLNRDDPLAHNDGIQCWSMSGTIFRHNAIWSRDTSCIAMFDGQGTWSDITIENNLLLNSGYLLYLGMGIGMKVLNNTMGGWGYAPATHWNPSGAGNVWADNVRQGTGAPVTPGG